jgi:hypothetical protein
MEEATSTLVTKVKTFEIRKITSKDIYKVVSLLRGAINCLTYIHKLPEDIIKILLQVFLTSSVDDFNATFYLLEKQRKQHAVLHRTGAPPDFLPADIFMLAKSKYRDMQTLNKWSGIHTKGSSAFHAGQEGSGQMQQHCFNCRGNHHVKQCFQPHDEAWINLKADKFKPMICKKFGDRKGGNGGGHGGGGVNKHYGKNNKWAPPLPKERNKHVIDGKSMFWLRYHKCWISDKDKTQEKQVHLTSKKQETEKKQPAAVAKKSSGMITITTST